ncbi:MAG: DUF4430 domain-containing protein [Bacillota bacterium]
MKRKLIFIVFFLVIIAGIMGPAIYTDKISSQKQAADRPVGGEAAGLTAGGQTPADSAAKSGVTSAQSTGLQTDNGSATRDTAGRKDNSAGTANQDSAAPAQKPAAASSAGAKEDGCTIGIAVVGMDGELLYGPGNVTVSKKNMWEVTALGALDATGLPYTMSTRWSGFVEAVAGQRNKGQAGWMYMVNGEIPMVAAGEKPVKTGDKVIWWYSKSMGAPIPDWNDLVRRGAGNTGQNPEFRIQNPE